MDESAEARIEKALQHWIETRKLQAERSRSGGRAQEGRRSSVTGGAHLTGLNQLVVDEIKLTGKAGLSYVTNRRATLAGYYRASKAWDLAVLQDGEPILVVEYKSMSGSEGKNLNNRADEVFGVAEDARQAEHHGLLPGNLRRAYVFLMEINADSTRPVGTQKVIGKMDPVFKGASYLERMAIMCQRLRDAGLYDLSWAVGVHDDPFYWEEPYADVGWQRFSADIHEAFS